MPTVTVQESVTLEQAAAALKDKLGSGYEITTHGSGDRQALKVKQSAAANQTRAFPAPVEPPPGVS
jgi:hypothetical protein